MSLENLEKAWAQTTEHHRAEGDQSYPSYHDTLRAFAKHYGVGFVPTVEAFVAMSPNNDYHGNLRSLSSVLHGYVTQVPFSEITVTTYRACALRALSYLSGEVSFLDTVKGKKITAFRHNILYPTKSKHVTVDGHMIGVWMGEDLTMSQANFMMRGSLYDEVSSGVRALARKEQKPPPAVQAALWVSKKDRQQRKYSSQLSLFSGKSRWVEIMTPEDCPPY